MGLAAAVVAAGAVSAVGAYAGSQAQAGAMTNAANIQHQQYLQNASNEAPYMAFGQNAMGALQSGTTQLGNYLGTNGAAAQTQAMAGYQNSPFFDQMQTNAANATLAQYAGQGRMGGNALTALNQQNASLNYQQYNNYLGQLTSYLGGLQGQVNTGAGATNALAGVGTQAAATQGQLTSGAGAATGAGLAGVGSSVGQGISNAALFSLFGNNPTYSNGPAYSASVS